MSYFVDAIKTIPGEYRFTSTLDDLVFLSPLGNICENLIDVDESVNQGVSIVKELVGTTFRCPPLMISRLGRGGKTTLLYLLFNALKQSGMMPIYINFNAHFYKYPNESQKQAILRMIALQLCDLERKEKFIYQVDDDAFIEYFDNISHGKQAILLIDEINMLSMGRPLESSAASFLKKHFLDRANRYLVYTTHLPLNVESTLDKTLGSTNSPPSPRSLRVIHLPESTDLVKLRSMSVNCQALTSTEVAIYGAIPSLIYVSKEYVHDASTKNRFDSAGIAVSKDEEPTFIGQFVASLLDGQYVSRLLIQRILIFSSVIRTSEGDLVKWPLCYITCIFSIFGSRFDYVQNMYQHLVSRAQFRRTGLDFETIVQFSVLFHCLDAAYNGTVGPFNVAKINSHPEFIHLVLPEEVETLKQALSFIKTTLQVSQSTSKDLLLFATFSYAQFPSIDGLIVSQRGLGTPNFYGYQIKAGKGYPRDEVPDVLTAGILIQGNPPEKRKRTLKWQGMTKSELKKLLGFSLQVFGKNL